MRVYVEIQSNGKKETHGVISRGSEAEARLLVRSRGAVVCRGQLSTITAVTPPDAWLLQPMSVDVTYVTRSRAATTPRTFPAFTHGNLANVLACIKLPRSRDISPSLSCFFRGRKPAGKDNRPLSAFVIDGSTNILARIIIMIPVLFLRVFLRDVHLPTIAL